MDIQYAVYSMQCTVYNVYIAQCTVNIATVDVAAIRQRNQWTCYVESTYLNPEETKTKRTKAVALHPAATKNMFSR